MTPPPHNKRPSDESADATTSQSQSRKRARGSRGQSLGTSLTANGAASHSHSHLLSSTYKSSPPTGLRLVPDEGMDEFPRPSSVIGPAGAVARLPASKCRDILAALPSSEVRALLMAHTIANPESRAATLVGAHYDALFKPRADQLVAFDDIVSSIKAALSSFVEQDLTLVGEPERLYSTLTSPNGVFTNIRVLHSSAVSPASFGTKLNALTALVAVNDFLIRGKLLLDPDPRDLFDKGPIGKAFLDVCNSLTRPERRMVLHSIGEDLGAQASAFRKNSVFAEVVEAYHVLKRSEAEGVVVQAMPIEMEEEDSQGLGEGGEGVNLLRDDIG